MICGKCGSNVGPGVRFCGQCGAAIDSAPGSVQLEEPAGASAAPPATQTSPTSPVSVGIRLYAGFWKRAAAYVIDSIILYVGLFVIAIAMGILGVGPADETGTGALFNLLGIAAFWLYYALLESGPNQATLGKRALKIKVVDYDGKRIGFGRATGRHFAKMLSGVIFGVGFFMAGFTERKQGLHDMIAGTLVVNRNARLSPIALDGRVLSGGAIATIVVAALVIPITILGILAAIALPAYQDYTMRAKMTEVLAYGRGAQSHYEEYYMQNGHAPANIDELRLPPAPKYIDGVRIGSGSEIVLEVILPDVQNGVIVLTPSVGTGQLTWECRSMNVKQQHLPAMCRP